MANIKDQWPKLKGSKEEICNIIAQKRNFNEIKNFVSDHISCCKQHVYVFSNTDQLKSIPLINFSDWEQIQKINKRQIIDIVYATRVVYHVLLNDPPERGRIEFVRPVKLQLTKDHFIVRFVKLDKNIKTYFDQRQCFNVQPNTEEKSVVKDLCQLFDVPLAPTDLQ